MRCLVVLTLLLSAALAGGQTEAKPKPDFQSLTHLFDYDAKQALDIQDKVIEEFRDCTLHDISYTSPKGGPVEAYLVVPKGKGPFAAVLFGHWAMAPGPNSFRKQKSMRRLVLFPSSLTTHGTVPNRGIRHQTILTSPTWIATSKFKRS
jgi:hypothetical protein